MQQYTLSYRLQQYFPLPGTTYHRAPGQEIIHETPITAKNFEDAKQQGEGIYQSIALDSIEFDVVYAALTTKKGRVHVLRNKPFPAKDTLEEKVA